MGSIERQLQLNQIPLLGVVPEQVTSDPGSPLEGRLWTRTDLHTLKVYLNSVLKTIATTDDSRFTDSRAPSGAAGGSLAGTFPNPTVAAGAITVTELNTALKPSGTAVDATEALRALGLTTGKAMPGTTRLDQIAAPTVSVSMNSQKLTSLLDGTNPQDAVTLAQLQAAQAGIDAKPSVKVRVTSAPGSYSANNWTTVPSTLDGYTPSTGDRILVDISGGNVGNGIFVYQPGDVLSRATDFDSWAEIPGAFVFVEQGTSQDVGYLCTNNAGGTLGSTAIVFTVFSTPGAYTGGAGLTLSGLDFSVNVDGSSIEINSDTLRVKAGGITNAMLAGLIDLTAKVTGVLPLANGGTGSSATTPIARTYTGASPALSSGVYTDVVHSLGVRAKSVQFVTAAGEDQVELDWRNKSGSETTTIQVKTDIVGGRLSNFYTISVIA